MEKFGIFSNEPVRIVLCLKPSLKSFLMLFVILSGDIELNPDPPRPPKCKEKGDNQPDDKKSLSVFKRKECTSFI